ncbi:MAG: methyltransferase domain-containing protein [Burkholderiales bacterium]
MINERFADNTSEQSVATRLRRQRFQILVNMLHERPGPVRLLDIGGTQGYWDMMLTSVALPPTLHVTLLNLEVTPVARRNFTATAGDARAMPQFADKQFDIVFSNSTIEHVGTWADQERMAREVRRLGRQYCVQTPNRYFPIESHFVFPCFQFLPLVLRVWLAQHFALGSYPRIPDRQTALREIASIRLLSRAEFQRLFPEATLYDEKYYGLTKSFVAYTPRRR